MKYKATEKYKELANDKNFHSVGSASTHMKLMAGEVVEYDKPLPKKLKYTLKEVKSKE